MGGVRNVLGQRQFTIGTECADKRVRDLEARTLEPFPPSREYWHDANRGLPGLRVDQRTPYRVRLRRRFGISPIQADTDQVVRNDAFKWNLTRQLAFLGCRRGAGEQCEADAKGKPVSGQLHV